jgi:restriction endonuclease Mrr
MGGAAVSIALKSGELWVFRHDAIAQMRLDASVFLEKGRLKPRATKQIVLSGVAMEYATRIRWSLSKAHETNVAIRDLNRDEMDLNT